MIKYIISCLFGVLIGLMIVSKIYLSSDARKIKKILNDNILDKDELKILQNIVHNLVKYHKKTKNKEYVLLFGLIRIKKKIDYHKLNQELLGINDYNELDYLDELWYLTNSTASLYVDSNRPLFELSINEATLLINNIIKELNLLISQIQVIDLRNLKISTIKKSYDIVRKTKNIYNDKRFRIYYGLFNLLIHLASFLTPAYFVKKISFMYSKDSLLNLIINLSFDITAFEVAKTYKVVKMENK